MCKEGKQTISKRLHWDDVSKVWRDYTGCVWDIKKDPLCDQIMAKIFNARFERVLIEDTLGDTYNWFLPKSEEDDGTYAFRGDVDLAHLIHDCIRDYRFGFVAIGEKYTYMGLLTGILDEINHPDFLENNLLTSYKDGYQLYKFNKSFTPQIVKWLPGAVATYRQVLKRKARKIRKRRGKLKGSPETKVMTY